MRRLLIAVFFIVWTVHPSFGETYLVYQDHGGMWHDADKTCPKSGDGLMCWAAAAANVLKWGHWDTADHDTEASIFECFNKHWTNGTGTPGVAWQWWFNGGQKAESAAGNAGHGANSGSSCDFRNFGTRPKDAESGHYWPLVNFYSYFHQESDPSRTMEAISDYLHKGFGVVIGVERHGRSTGHVVTVWGCETDKNGAFEGVFITNSDDGGRQLDYLRVEWNDSEKRWEVPVFDGYIKEVWALAPRPETAS